MHKVMIEETPILRTPYEEPTTYHMLDERGQTTNEICNGRRPSEASSGIPNENGNDIIIDSASIEPHMTINGIRDAVSQWRQSGWKGATANTRRLLEFWNQSDPGVGMRPFWCQMEAIETMIWLFEAGQVHDPAFHKKVTKKIYELNNAYNDGVQRTAIKMATGTGKTNVMAMAMLWMLVNDRHHDDGGITNFLVITPNLTVKKRLEVLDPKKDSELWNAITPREFHRTLSKAQVTVVNFHVFQKRAVTMDGKPLGAKEKKILGSKNKDNFIETELSMINRVLREHISESKVVVINDEAHHCYMPQQQEKKRDEEDVEYQKAAALWFSALKLLKEHNRLTRVCDFSATPMYLTKPKSLNSVVFPWTVSDFSLLDAIESGLVKIPRVPVKDDVDSYQPKYRNIYEYNSGKELAPNLAVKVKEPLEQLYKQYHDVINPKYGEKGIIPIFIIVANNIKNAVAIYRWIAGSCGTNDKRGTRGNLELFSNYDQNGNPQQHPPTLLVHSRLFEKTPTSVHEKEMVGEQATLFGLEGSLDKKQEQIRNLFTSVGYGDARHIRCVISIGMLTEGWDAKNVTHVFGYRKFGSQLLCEQVTGRALRRTSFVGNNKQLPEYANVFGVPYTFAHGDDGPIQPPAQPYRVFSVSGKEKFRVSFPNVIRYVNSKRQRRFKLNPNKVKPYKIEKKEPKITDVEGTAGDGVTIKRDRRVQTAIWEMARRVAELLNRDTEQNAEQYVMNGRNISFVDSCKMVKQYLDHPKITCTDRAGIIADDNIPLKIAEACEHKDETVGIRPVFADEHQSGDRLLTTEGIRFITTLQHQYKPIKRKNTTIDNSDMADVPSTFLKKSELNRSACHSDEETIISKILDSHPDIEAWARNFRLDFKIRWFNDVQSLWKDMDPDFVARVKTKENDKPIHLVIEFKGMKKGEVEEGLKKYYMEKWWCPAVSAYNDGKYGEWKTVWIEDVNSAKMQISEACKT